MQRPKRPGRSHIVPPDFDWDEDVSRPGTPSPNHRPMDPRWDEARIAQMEEPFRTDAQSRRLRNRFHHRLRLVNRRRNRDNHWTSFNFSVASEVPINLIQDQAPPPRPAPPLPVSHDPLPGPSSSGENNDVMSRLLSVLECPVCFEYVSPPILQCREGHLVCSGCRARLDLCPKCRLPFVDIRARALEQVAEVVPYPCYNNGCDALLPLSERQAHEAVCPFRQYPCTVETCNWLGQRSSLPQHMLQNHPSSFSITPQYEISLTLTPLMNEEKTFLMHCYGELFHCVMGVDCQQDIFVGLVMLLGPREKARDFEFELKFKKDTLPYTSVVFKRCTLEESPVGTQLSGTSAVVISFSTLREVLHEGNARGPVLTVHVSVSRRPDDSPASPEEQNSLMD